MRLAGALRSVALFEAAKGALVLVVGFGLLAFTSGHVQHFAVRLVHHLHLNPSAHEPLIFTQLSEALTNGRVALLAAGAAAYASLRFVEAYGLWHGRSWAEWLAAVSGAIYIPFEVLNLYHHHGWVSATALVANTLVVALMLAAVSQRRRARSVAAGQVPGRNAE
jgi:uncharacterized membrane protein (DUF2068 family)